MKYYPMPHPPSHKRGGDSRGLVFDRLMPSVYDRLGPQQSGQKQQLAPVRSVSPGTGPSLFSEARILR